MHCRAVKVIQVSMNVTQYDTIRSELVHTCVRTGSSYLQSFHPEAIPAGSACKLEGNKMHERRWVLACVTLLVITSHIVPLYYGSICLQQVQLPEVSACCLQICASCHPRAY